MVQDKAVTSPHHTPARNADRDVRRIPHVCDFKCILEYDIIFIDSCHIVAS